MYIEALERQMAVCSFDGAARLTSLDRGYWNVVSIYGPRQRRAGLPHAKAIHYCCFDDIEDEDSTTSRSPRAEDVAAAFTFIDRLLPGAPREPLMIHCEQGVSRSTALALSWVYGHLPGDSQRGIQAIDIILALRPLAKPNRLVLRLGLVHFVTASEANRLADWIVREPRLARNRFEASEPE